MNAPVTATEQILREIIARKLKVEPEAVSLDTPLMGDTVLDSMDKMAVILEIEEAFPGVDLSVKEAADVQTLGELAAFIDGRLTPRRVCETRDRPEK